MVGLYMLDLWQSWKKKCLRFDSISIDMIIYSLFLHDLLVTISSLRFLHDDVFII